MRPQLTELERLRLDDMDQDATIMSRMLEEYARDRDQAKLGRDAMEKWERVKR